jgi:hypothetical protein
MRSHTHEAQGRTVATRTHTYDILSGGDSVLPAEHVTQIPATFNAINLSRSLLHHPVCVNLGGTGLLGSSGAHSVHTMCSQLKATFSGRLRKDRALVTVLAPGVLLVVSADLGSTAVFALLAFAIMFTDACPAAVLALVPLPLVSAPQSFPVPGHHLGLLITLVEGVHGVLGLGRKRRYLTIEQSESGVRIMSETEWVDKGWRGRLRVFAMQLILQVNVLTGGGDLPTSLFM